MLLDNAGDLPDGSGDSPLDVSVYPDLKDENLLFTTGLPGGLTTRAVLVNATADNSTVIEFHLRHSVGVTVLLAVLAGAISLTTIFGNLLVLVAFALDRTLRQPGNYLIASLASADLLIGIFSMPLYTMYLLMDEQWPLGWVSCDLWLSLDYTVCLVSQYTVFYITLDRFLVVKFTATYRLWLTTKRAKLIVAGIWIGSCLLFFPSITGWQFFVGKRTVPTRNCYAQFMENPLFNTILVILYYWVTLFVISILYTFIYRKAWEMERRRKAEHKRAQMVHMKLAQATLGRLGGSVTTPSSPTAPRKRTTTAGAGPHRPLISDTTEDDENKSTSSSLSTSWSVRKRGAFNQSRIHIKALSASTSLAGITSSLPVHRTLAAKPAKASAEQNFSLSYKSKHHTELEDAAESTSTVEPEKPNFSKYKKLFQKKRSPEKQSPEREPFVQVPTETETDTTAPSNLGTGGESRGATPPKQKVDPGQPIRRSYSDLEPVLTVGGLMKVPVDELVGIEFIDDDALQGPLSYPPKPIASPFSGNAVYRLRLGPSLQKKSATFENLPSARTEKTIRARLDRLLKDTRERVSNGFCISGSQPVAKAAPGKRRSVSESTAAKADSSGKKKSLSQNLFGGNRSHLVNTLITKKTKVAYHSRAHKALRMISFILGVFVITWTPYHILAIIMGFSPGSVNSTLYAISYWFCYLNSPISLEEQT